MRAMAVILNYRSASLSCRCAEGLLALGCPDLGVCIVDNESGEGMDELEGFCAESGVTLIPAGRNGGFSAGNNVGLRHALDVGCEYGLVINPDVEIRDPGFVEKCIAALDGDPSVAVLGPDVLHRAGFHQNPMREPSYLEELFWPVEALKGRLSGRPLYHDDPAVGGYCQKVSGCCFFVRLDALAAMGFLDEGVFLYCEEPILAARVARAGLHEYYLPAAVAYHMHAGGNDKSTANLERVLNSRLYYLREYSGYSTVALRILEASKRLQTRYLAKRGSSS